MKNAAYYDLIDKNMDAQLDSLSKLIFVSERFTGQARGGHAAGQGYPQRALPIRWISQKALAFPPVLWTVTAALPTGAKAKRRS